MKLTIILLSVYFACVSSTIHVPNSDRRKHWPEPSTGPTYPRPPKDILYRFRREANPQGSLVLQGTQPLSGPNRQPTIDLNYNHRVFRDQRGHVDVYGGANLQSGKVNPHAGIQFERNYRNGYLGGYGQVQPGPRGRVDPTVGLKGGFRF